MVFQRKSSSIIFLLACSLVLSQVTSLAPKSTSEPKKAGKSKSLAPKSTSEPKKAGKSKKSSGAPTVTISPTSSNKAKLPNKSEKAGKYKAKYSSTPTVTISPIAFQKAKSGSKAKKAGKSASLTPTVTNSPTLTTKSSKQDSATQEPPDRTVGETRVVDTPEETASSDISNEETPEDTATKEGRGSETNVMLNGEAVAMTDGSDQNENGEKAIIANSDGITDTAISGTTIIGLVVLGAVFCGVAAGVYMKMSAPNPTDEN